MDKEHKEIIIIENDLLYRYISPEFHVLEDINHLSISAFNFQDGELSVDLARKTIPQNNPDYTRKFVADRKNKKVDDYGVVSMITSSITALGLSVYYDPDISLKNYAHTTIKDMNFPISKKIKYNKKIRDISNWIIHFGDPCSIT